MDDFMIAKWNSVVADEDTVIHGGDFALGNMPLARRIFEQLKGNKIIVLGNHDRKKRLQQMGFTDIRNFWYENGILVVHIPWDLPIDYQKQYEECKIALYGHTHNKPVLNPEYIKIRSMCVELNNYTPFTLE
jgi:calcineurin-like phosphoesterase family protein